MSAELIEYGDASARYQGYLSVPSGPGPRPCVLVFHDWSGVSETTHEAADRIAQAGYAAFALDLYGKGRRGQSPEACAALMQPFLDDRERLLAPVSQAMDVLRKDARVDTRHMAAMGFCFGGLCVLDLARRGLPLQGVASVHGVPAAIPGVRPERIDPRILVLQGSEDPWASPAELAALSAELSAARADWQLHVFGGVRHAFTNPAADDAAQGIQYDAAATRRTWTLVEDFLDELLG